MRSNLTICCDASIVVDYVIASNPLGIQELWNRLGATPHRLVAPRLFLYEVTNAIHRIALRTPLSPSDAERTLELAIQVPIELLDDEASHRRALAISQQFRLAATYDAHYLALAESLGCPFYTSDAKLVSAVRHHFSWVHLV
jgi:predicted nucleic acid-binding protein